MPSFTAFSSSYSTACHFVSRFVLHTSRYLTLSHYLPLCIIQSFLPVLVSLYICFFFFSFSPLFLSPVMISLQKTNELNIYHRLKIKKGNQFCQKFWFLVISHNTGQVLLTRLTSFKIPFFWVRACNRSFNLSIEST